MRAVGFRRAGITFDVALRYRFAYSLEHYNGFIDWLFYASKQLNNFVGSRSCRSHYTIVICNASAKSERHSKAGLNVGSEMV